MMSKLKYPRYLNIKEEEFDRRIEKAYKLLSSCEVCPRKCGVKRLEGEKGFCRSSEDVIVSSYNAHFGEEPPLVGNFGSGTIFFTNCNLKCVYCQNYPISQLGNGNKVTLLELAKIMLALQKRKCHNINLVTPTHFVPQILKSLKLAVKMGLHIPIVYNTSGYEEVRTLKLLADIVDIYLPDARYADNEIALKYSSAPDYFEIMKKALKEMHRQVGDLAVDKTGVACSGLIVRHLVLPEGLSNTRKIMRFIAREISPHTYISLMAQYFPAYQAGQFPALSRRINREEYREALQAFKEEGLESGWFQQGI
ncbi:radical SAM protein [Candidatus Atribacteria bacterium HGW-Atribacteria-1]|nr:MAG: radical SAM protein [Candidatus Atribacteria bacterium HGW-Atribacteria-1]